MIDSADDAPKEGLDFVKKSLAEKRHRRMRLSAGLSRIHPRRAPVVIPHCAPFLIVMLVAACAAGTPTAKDESGDHARTTATEVPSEGSPAARSAGSEPTGSAGSTDDPREPSSEPSPTDASGQASNGDDAASSNGADSSPTDETTASSPEEEPDQEARKAADRKRRRRVLLRTAYDDRSVGEEQGALVESELGIYSDERLERYINSVAVRLLRHAPPQPFDYEFKIVDQVVPNAFALPGGKIFLSRGLLALVGSEDELAAVLGHEITHAAERHAAARIEHASRINPFVMGYMRAATIAAYGREHERDADRGGQILCARAGYDPNGIATFLRKLDASERYEVGWSRLPSFLATHPTSPERSAIAAQRSSELEWERSPSVASEVLQDGTYMSLIDGLVLGDDPAGGLFKDGRFVHPDMRFSLRFPKGWPTQNSPQSVSAISPGRDAEASLSAIGSSGDLDKAVDDFLAAEVDGIRIKVLDRKPIKIGNLTGVRVEGRARDLYSVMAFVEYEGIIFRMTMLSLSGSARKYRGRASAFIQSFRPLDEEGRYSLEVTRLRVARALDNETLQQLTVRTNNDLELVYTGVLNDLFPGTQLERGQLIKIGLGEPYFPTPPEPEAELKTLIQLDEKKETPEPPTENPPTQ